MHRTILDNWRLPAKLLAAVPMLCSAYIWPECTSSVVWAEERATNATRSAVKNESVWQFGKLRVQKILFLGNSITLHGPAPHIGWHGNWGMAATSQEKDYVHLILGKLAAATGKQSKVHIKNAADFERNFNDYDLAAGLKEELDFQADVIIIALGENAVSLNTDELRSQFHTAFTNLLDIFKKQGRPAIFVRGTFWLDEDKNSIMKKACEESGGFFVDNSKLGEDEANFARSERKIDHSGVAGHPGDKGMQAIADSIWIEIEKQAKLNDSSIDP
jgi:lysophospholipase L1-like esterase